MNDIQKMYRNIIKHTLNQGIERIKKEKRILLLLRT